MSASDHSANFRGRRYTPDQLTKIVERRVGKFGGAYWKVYVNGVLYQVARERGSRPIRIMYKPRGENIGYHWFGAVRDNRGRDLWTGRVLKSTGPLTMLHDAGLFRWTFETEVVT